MSKLIKMDLKKSTASKTTKSSIVLMGIGLGFIGLSIRKLLRRYAVNRLTAPARVTGKETPAAYGLNFEEVWFHSRDNLRLHGWYIPAENSKATIITAHGYSGCKISDLRYAHWLWQAGYNVFMFDFRAHGLSEGLRGTSLGYLERLDIHAAVDYLLGLGERRIGVFGISMGASAAIIAAGENPHLSAVVADSPYSHLFRSISTEITRLYHLKMWLATPAAKFAFKAVADYQKFKVSLAHPAEYVPRISPRPIFLIHGGGDKLTRVENSQILFELAEQPKQLWVESGVEHGQMFEVYPAEYQRKVLEFFDKVAWQTTLQVGIPDRWEGQKRCVTLDGKTLETRVGKS